MLDHHPDVPNIWRQNMGSLVNQATTAYETWKSSKDLTTMNESELNSYNITCVRFDKAINDANEIETSFYSARDAAFQELEQNYQTQRANLASLWQSKENNGFDVDYTS